MAPYSCCGIPFDTADAYREHRRRIHGEEVTASAEAPARGLARLLRLIGRRSPR